MKYKIEGGSSFSHIKFVLNPGDKIVTESDAMASMDAGLSQTAKMNGHIIKAFLKKFFGGESLFVNHFENNTQEPKEIVITKNTPGEIVPLKLEGKGMYLQPGAYICSTPGIHLIVEWAGFRSFLAREGLFRLYAAGTGYLWFGAYGRIVPKTVKREYLVDTGHLVAYEPQMGMKLQMSGNLMTSLLSGEGLLTRMEGDGKIFLQTRSMGGLAAWLNPRL